MFSFSIFPCFMTHYSYKTVHYWAAAEIDEELTDLLYLSLVYTEK